MKGRGTNIAALLVLLLLLLLSLAFLFGLFFQRKMKTGLRFRELSHDEDYEDDTTATAVLYSCVCVCNGIV
jgi:hypothetical protein